MVLVFAGDTEDHIICNRCPPPICGVCVQLKKRGKSLTGGMTALGLDGVRSQADRAHYLRFFYQDVHINLQSFLIACSFDLGAAK
jgi:hypothetical protein